MKKHWNPKPVTPPTVDPALPNLSGVQRSTESFRYITLKTEHWLSPNGRLREWMRHHMLLSAVLAVPAFLVLPIIGFILWQLVKCLGMLTLLAGHLILFTILAVVAFLIISTIFQIIKALFR
jgi:hypothetical protein